MNTRAKGNRNELKAKKLLEDAGYQVERTKGTLYGAVDFFGRWDLIAVREGEIRWIQVKTNRLPSPAYRQMLKSFEAPGSKELWVFYDRKPEHRVIML